MSKSAVNGRFTLPATIIVMPAFNEGQVIGSVIREIHDIYDLPILVVDDASTDDTVARAESAGATVIRLLVQLGAWGATQTGMRYALRHHFEFVISMDADGQHEAKSLREILEPIASGKADVAIGACTRRGSLLRKIAWGMMKQVSGVKLEDITSGFRVYNRKAIRELASWRATFLDYQDIGVLLLLQSKNIVIADVEVPMQARRNGKSRVFHSWLTVIYYMSHTLLLGLSKRRMASKRPYKPVKG